MLSTTDDDVEVWRRFHAGESVQQIAKSLDLGKKTVLLIVLSVEQEMGSSCLFHENATDAEGCPDPIPKQNIKIPSTIDGLERFLRKPSVSL